MDPLRPAAADVLEAWAARVRANRQQVDEFREASPADFYAPVAGMFRADPHRTDDPTLDVLRSLVLPSDTVLDIGAGGGRYALPLALFAHEVIALDPSEGMLDVLRGSVAEHHIANVRVVHERWPSRTEPEPYVDRRLGTSVPTLKSDVALISHLGYDVEDIGPFLDAMESVARRLCIAVLLDRPPPTEADRFWPAVHGVERAALPALPEFLNLLLARGHLFELRLVDRDQQSFAEPDQVLAVLRQQLWTRPGSAKDERLVAALRERIQERDGRYALNWEPARVGIVTWSAHS